MSPFLRIALAPALCLALALPTQLASAAGAIAKGQGTRLGYSHSYNTIPDAERRALQECGGGCRIAVSFQSGCGAVATDTTSGSTVWGAGRGANRATAENYAIGFCRQYGGQRCSVRRWVCTKG